jgi:glycogen(starch) synthase
MSGPRVVVKSPASKILLVGPYPPPHGGISVHVRNARAALARAGVACKVLNTEGRSFAQRIRIFEELVEHAEQDWIIHVHTNGHNIKSWLVALAGGLAAQRAHGGILTLHSGVLPAYLAGGSRWRRIVALRTSNLYHRVVCVNQEIARCLQRIGVPSERLQVLPAYLPAPLPVAEVPDTISSWLSAREPILSTTLFFSPEYGFEVLVEAIRRLRKDLPRLGCLVMGGSDGLGEAECLVRERGIRDAVFLAGDIDNDVCLELMSRSDLFVRATFRDGDSISVREAHALGLPVVASDVGCRPPGTLLFTAGNVEELVDRIGDGLSIGRAALDRNGDAGSLERLISLYGF